MLRQIDIVYFSGTGGTERAAKCFEAEFLDKGYELRLMQIKGSTFFGYQGKKPLLLLFPVYEMNAPAHVYDWLKSIGSVDELPAMVISVSGGGEKSPNTACRTKAISLLESKGYAVTYEEMLTMPANVFICLKPELSKTLLEVLPEKVRRIAADIDAGTVRRVKPQALDRLFTRLGAKAAANTKEMGKQFHVSDACIGCGWCAEHCPTGNISISDAKPVFSDKCNFCLSCIYGCPEKAISTKKGSFAIIKQGYDLSEIERLPHIENPDIDNLTKGPLYGGMRKYLKD